MGRIKKETLFLLIKRFEEMNEEIEKTQQIDVEILTDCQSLAIDLGNNIELIYKEINTSGLIHKLEAYCEFVYQLSLPENFYEMKRILKKIRRLLFSIESDIRFLLPEDKKVVVFLPYKASMWDSLESIYFAAKEDLTCEAYVVPIPYYEKNQDGSFGKMHYDGNKFPDNIPITPWQEFSIEENRPDVIFIHNPYDGWNLVTSVLPQFYCSELKKHTDELVYVPYFTLHEIKMDNRIEVDKIKHLISNPGVIYADRIIVQSEEMKKIYVKEFIAWAQEWKLPEVYTDEKYQDNKIVGMGSPKFDKLFCDGAKQIPIQWEEKITIGENRKKVIFFNTNVSLILNNGEYFVENLKRIEKIFEKYSKEYVVIWREHPLTYETMKSMRQNMIRDYMEFRENFIKNNWVIIDEMPEWHQAAAISDCYYGAGGSLSALYLATKKPIMITDYQYPNGISDKVVTIEMMFRTMNKKHYFNERFSNSLDLLLSEFMQVVEHQKRCLEFLPEPDKIKEFNIGKKIYDYCCGQRKGKV